MITTQDVSDILYGVCRKEFGINTYHHLMITEGEVLEDRVTIHPKAIQKSMYWNTCFVEVNISVPDRQSRADMDKLQSYSRKAVGILDGESGEYDGTAYRYSVFSIDILEDVDLRCHYVNVRVKFEILNAK